MQILPFLWKLFWRRNNLCKSLGPLPTYTFSSSHSTLHHRKVLFTESGCCPPHVTDPLSAVAHKWEVHDLMQHKQNRQERGWFWSSSFNNSSKKKGFLHGCFLVSAAAPSAQDNLSFICFWKEMFFSASNKNPQNPAMFPFPTLLEDQGRAGRLLSDMEEEQINPWRPCGHPGSTKSEKVAQRRIWSTPDMCKIIKITIFTERKEKLENWKYPENMTWMCLTQRQTLGVQMTKEGCMPQFKHKHSSAFSF